MRHYDQLFLSHERSTALNAILRTTEQLDCTSETKDNSSAKTNEEEIYEFSKKINFFYCVDVDTF